MSICIITYLIQSVVAASSAKHGGPKLKLAGDDVILSLSLSLLECPKWDEKTVYKPPKKIVYKYIFFHVIYFPIAYIVRIVYKYIFM